MVYFVVYYFYVCEVATSMPILFFLQMKTNYVYIVFDQSVNVYIQSIFYSRIIPDMKIDEGPGFLLSVTHTVPVWRVASGKNWFFDPCIYDCICR